MRASALLHALLRRGWRPLAILSLCLVACLAQAQSEVDPPSRVARLSYISGDLGFMPAGAKDWSDASINRPLTTGDRLSTGRDSRAELELGGASLRMDGQSDVGVLNLTEQLAQLELTQGTLNLHVRRVDQGQSYEIDTPTVALVIDQPGTYRIDIDDNGGSTRISAFDGSAVVYGENNAQRNIHPGRSYQFDDSSLAAVSISDIGGGDAFDAWCDSRQQRYAQSISQQYVSDDVVGYQDLDQYGQWEPSSDYGEVWYPSQVAADWAPYRDGHWAYIAPWGWTWIDAMPWGYAPYHYGRWAYTHRGWGWIPGPLGVRPIYAPALVAFVGSGGWSIGIGASPIGWFPLGPGEIYNPWYHASRRYYSNVNITNIRITRVINRTTVINNVDRHYNHYRSGQPESNQRYANRGAPRGFTAVPGSTFVGGKRVPRDLLRVDPNKFRAAPVLAHGVNVSPIAISHAAPRSPHARSLPTDGFRRDVVAHRAPPAPRVINTLAGPRPVETPVSHVRVLNPRGVDRQPGMPHTDAPLPRTSNVASDPVIERRGHPVEGNPIDRSPVDRTPIERAPVLRPGELPSSRFAHRQPGEPMPHNHLAPRLRPVQQDMSSSREPAPRNVEPPRNIEQGSAMPAQTRRSMPIDQRVPGRATREEAAPTQRRYTPVPRGDDYRQPPLQQRPQPRPVYTPMPVQSPRQEFRPRDEQPSRAEPERARATAHAERKRESRPQKADEQH